MNEQQFSTLLREEWDRIPVGAPPVAAVVGRASHQGRRRRTVRVGAALAAAAAVVVAVVVVATRPAPQDPRPIGPVVDNPVDVAWTDGRSVHLARTALDLGDDLDDWASLVSRVAEPGGGYGAVYVDGRGGVHHVDSLGRTRTIGRTAPDAITVAGSSTSTWAAWVTSSDGGPELVVHDTATDEEVAREALSPDTVNADGAAVYPAVIAVDGERVWLRTAAGDQLWQPDQRLAESPYDGSSVLDAAAGTVVTVRDAPDGTRTVSFGRDGEMPSTLRGREAVVSPDGRYVLVDRQRQVGGLADWRLYDVATGGELGLDLPDLSERLVDQAALSADHAVLVTRTFPSADDLDAGNAAVLVSCSLADGRCVELPEMAMEDGSLVVVRLEE